MKDGDLSQTLSAVTNGQTPLASRESLRRWALGGVALILIVYAYGINRICLFQASPTSLLTWLVASWGRGADYAHGYLVPIVAAGIFYWKWRSTLRHLPMESSTWGLAVVGVAMLLYVTGVRAQENRIIASSLVVLIFGIVFYLGGWTWAKHCWFPCAFLFYMIPITFLDLPVSFPLRMFVAKTSSGLLNLLGLDVYSTGTGIHSRAGRFMPLDVADPCSGIRSLVALMALTSTYGYLAMDRSWKKWVLFLSSIPLAVIGNLARITTVALVAQGFGNEPAMKIYHDFSGYIVFSLAILCMLGLGTLLNLHYREILDHWMQDELPPNSAPRKTG